VNVPPFVMSSEENEKPTNLDEESTETPGNRKRPQLGDVVQELGDVVQALKKNKKREEQRKDCSRRC